MDISMMCAGFGGQGVMTAGKLLCYTVNDLTNDYVTFFPSYGSQMRGGTANCFVCISDKPIGPVKPSHVDYLMIFNNPSMVAFKNNINPGGVIFANSSLVEEKVDRDDVTVVEIPATDIAIEIGSPQVLNLVMLGAFIGYTDAVPADKVVEEMYVKLGAKHPEYNERNKMAFDRGFEIGKAARKN